ncbi:MAG: chemotaxis protein CheW [Minwuia sp.]|uniref:chemotaxis protein CheW n=1 Tax=Minwuia sp. TaxID=2493630 RepID=UPI003A8A2C0A
MKKEVSEIDQKMAGCESIITSHLGNQVFGLPILTVNDVIAQGAMTRVPLGPPEVAGLINLRGRIVTAIDMHRRFGRAVGKPAEGSRGIGTVIVVDGEWYSLMFDRIGEVVPVSDVVMMPLPPTVRPEVAALSFGVAKRPDELVIMLDVKKILEIPSLQATKLDLAS